MPTTKSPKKDRINIRVPRSMIDEIDLLIKKAPSLAYNRQQFIEQAIRKEIMQTWDILKRKKED